MTSIFSTDCFQENSRLSAALELADLGCWEISLLDKKFWMSDRFKSHFGYAGNSISDYQNVLNLVHADYRQYADETVNDAFAAGPGGSFNIEIKTKAGRNGRDYWLNWKGKFYAAHDGKPSHFSGIVQDISSLVNIRQQNEKNDELLLTLKDHNSNRLPELEKLNYELAVVNEEFTAANEELASANRLLTKSNENLAQFAYVASHDLQEPLRKIQVFGERLKGRIPQDPESADYIHRMQVAANRMSLLIGDLLNLSHVSSAEQEFSRIELNKVMSNVLSDLEATIQLSGAVINVSSLPAIKGDATQLAQLFQNLLSNAIKFMRSGVTPQIQISWNIVKAAAISDHLEGNAMSANYNCIEIADNGIGFDQANEKRIFKIFHRLHGKSEFDGTGIGLAICEKVVANHHGVIRAQSEIGAGSTFRVYLPI